MKRKSITLTICILAVLALASIGFASWIISNPNSGDVADGTIWVDDVESQVFDVETTLSVTSIQFGVPTDYQAKATDWLTNDSGKTESLETVLTVVIKPETGANLNDTLNAASLGVTLSGIAGSDELTFEELSQRFTNAGLAAPVITIKNPSNSEWVAFTDGKIDFADLDVDETAGTGTCEIKVTFGWGTNGNPYTYYNGVGRSYDTHREEAETFLNGVYNALNGLSYKITIK